jgi:hypothetical protein
MVVLGGGTDGSVGVGYKGKNLVSLTPLSKTNTVLNAGFNYDLTKPLHKAWNVVTEIALPFVCWAGFDECYLIGCDCTNSGYFYTDPVTTRKQHVDDKVLPCYDVIANTELPTKIYNAGIGGKLESFLRVSLRPEPMKMETDLLVVGYYTPERNYEQLAHAMKRSVEAQGLQCEIRFRPSQATAELKKPMPWVLNCGLCGFFIRDMLHEYPDRRLLYLDADATMLRSPELLLKDTEFEFAAPMLTNKYVKNELVSNTLYFKPTEACNKLLNAWCGLQSFRNGEMLADVYKAPYREAWDQKTLQDSLLKMKDIKFKELPWAYAKIDKTKAGEELMPCEDEIVIAQHQASRENKHHV